MVMKCNQYYLFKFVIFLPIITSCIKLPIVEEPELAQLPVVITTNIFNNLPASNACFNDSSCFTYYSVTIGGRIISDGGAPITERGVFWGIDPNSTTEKCYSTKDGEGVGEFKSLLFTPEPNTSYYVRAYATNSCGTSYGEVISFVQWLNIAGPVLTDTCGNTYKTVKIGNQIWMAENLKTTKYRDGTPIPFVGGVFIREPEKHPFYSWYANDSLQYCNPYGALYSFQTVINDKGICPTGWRLPIPDDVIYLGRYLGPSSLVSGGRMKTTGTEYWKEPNRGANNLSGFSALPGGWRYGDGSWKGLGYRGYYWGPPDDNSAQGFTLNTEWGDVAGFGPTAYNKKLACSVRCIKE